MIITVTLNPAVDKTMIIDQVKAGHVNKIKSSRLDAGGKGINVSKVIKTLGGTSKAIGFLAGNSGEFIKKYLESENIDHEFIFVNGETRTNIKIIDPIAGLNTDLNENGPAVNGDETHQLESILNLQAGKGDYVVFSGSVPKDIPGTIYSKWIQLVQQNGARACLDADGDLLKIGLEAAPYFVKPNIHELERLFGVEIKTVQDAAMYGKKILDYGVELVAISMGEEGALFICNEWTMHAKPKPVKVLSTVGAGDSMVAAMAYALERKMDLKEAMRLSTATGTANVTTAGTNPAGLDQIQKIKASITLDFI